MKLLIRRSIRPVLAGVVLACATIPAHASDASIEPVAAQVPADDPLAELVDEAIRISARRRLDTRLHTPWQIVHGVLAYRQEFLVWDGEKEVSALKWMTEGVSYKGDPWFEKTPYGGRAHRFTKPYAFEGHPEQFLAILSMSDLPRDFEFQTRNGAITVEDIIRNAQMEVNTKEEITWTLWFLSAYLPPDATWTSKRGESWSIERLVQIEVRNDVNKAACGGTHGLFALASARNAYLRTGRPLSGVWVAADQKLQRHIQAARMLQNRDGTFSTKYFTSRGSEREFEKVLASTGHTLEFVVRALPDDRLKEEWVRRAVSKVANGLIENRNAPLECGPLYHALSGLVQYRERTRPRSPSLLAGVLDDESAKPMPSSDPHAQVPTPGSASNGDDSQTPPASVAKTPNRLTLPLTDGPHAGDTSSISPVPQPVAPSKDIASSEVPARAPVRKAVPPSPPKIDLATVEKVRREAAAREARQRLIRIAVESRMAEAEAARAEAEARRAEAVAKQAAADAKRAEAAARRAEAEALRAEAESLRQAVDRPKIPKRTGR